MTLIAEIAGIPPVPVEPYPLTLADLYARHPLQVWPEPLTAAAFEDTEFDGHWYAVVAPTPPPTLAWGERAVKMPMPVNDAGTWRQAWTVESITLAEAKEQLRLMARGILEERVERLSSVEEHLIVELERLENAQAAGLPITPTQYPLVQNVGVVRGITFAQGALLANNLRTAWESRAAQFSGRYIDVLDRIQNAPDNAAAHAIYLELAAIP